MSEEKQGGWTIKMTSGGDLVRRKKLAVSLRDINKSHSIVTPNKNQSFPRDYKDHG